MATDLRPRKSPRQLRSVETRRRILDAAARVVATHGYAAGTTNRIAEEAGVSIGSLYQYYPNKDAILAVLMTEHVEAGLAAGQDLLASEDGSGRVDELLTRSLRATIALHRGDPRLHAVLFSEAPRPPELVRRLVEAERLAVQRVEQLLGAHPDVRVDDARMAARVVVASIESLVHRLVAADHAATPMDDATLDSFEHEVVSMLTRYLCPGLDSVSGHGSSGVRAPAP